MLLSIYQRKDRSARWLALTAFFGGGSFFSNAMLDTIIPNLAQLLSSEEIHRLRLVAAASFYLSFAVTPYAFACLSIRFDRRWGKYGIAFMSLLLAVPPVMTLIHLWPDAGQFPYSFRIQPFTQYWAALYIIGSSCLLIYGAFFRDQVERSRLDRRVIAVLLVPVMLTIWLVGYVFNDTRIWRLNAFVIFLVFVLFIFLFARFGILGLRLRIERERMDLFMQSHLSSANILNHALKNQVDKIKMAVDLIKREDRDDKLAIPTDIIEASTDHLSNLVYRIQDKLGSEGIHPERLALQEWLLGTVDLFLPELQQRGIRFELGGVPDIAVRIDPVHLREVIINLINNAVDALEGRPEPRIEMHVFTRRRIWGIEVRDNGAGVPKPLLPRVVEPFFTTKQGGGHEGLGLAYCYTVIQKHEGRMELQSNSSGTTVILRIPEWREEGKLDSRFSRRG